MGEKIQKSERKKIPKRKILRIKSKGNFVWARGFTIKEKVSSNLPTSSVNGKRTTHVFFDIQQVHSGKNHLWPSIDL